MSGVAILYTEELKATVRGQYAWLGAAVVLLAIGGFATVGTQDTWLDGYGIVAYGLVPLAFIPFAAGAIASPRANRFVESLFTAPVERRDWLMAKILVLLSIAAAYYVALIPMQLVYMHHVGLPFLLGRFLLWTPGILIASIAIGTLAGVLFIGRSVAAPAGTGMGVLLAYVGLVPLQELLVARGNGATRSGHITLASPAVLLKNALGFALAAGRIPASTMLTWISFLFVVAGAFALAGWVFLRAQGVETWETTRAQRWPIALSIAAIVLLPVLLAGTNYDRPAPAANLAPVLRGISGRAAGSLALVPPGGQLPVRCCSALLNREDAPLGTDERTQRDMLLLLPVDGSTPVTGLEVQIVGEDGLEVTTGAPSPLEPHTFARAAGPAAAAGPQIMYGWGARGPGPLMAGEPGGIGGNRYPLNVLATYRVAPGAELRKFSARGAIEAEVSSAIYEMGAASSVLPLLCLAAAFNRWRRPR